MRPSSNSSLKTRRAPEQTERIEIPHGREGTAKTLEIMASVALTDARDSNLRTVADGIFRHDAQAFPIAVESWLRRRWVIKPDPPDVEAIKRPSWIVYDEDYSGDCDDAATLAGSLCLAYPERIYGWTLDLVAIRMPTEDDFSHVWLSCDDGRFHVDIDPIVPAAELPVRGFAETMSLRLFPGNGGVPRVLVNLLRAIARL